MSNKRFTEEDKRQHYEQWLDSQLPAREYCKQHGLAKSTFYQWQKTFSRKQKAFRPMATTVTQSVKKYNTIEIVQPGQLSIKVPCDMGAEFIAAIIKGCK